MKIENHKKVNLHRSDAIIFTAQKIVTIIPRIVTFCVSAVRHYLKSLDLLHYLYPPVFLFFSWMFDTWQLRKSMVGFKMQFIVLFFLATPFFK
jgi:hypothetical protein